MTLTSEIHVTCFSGLSMQEAIEIDTYIIIILHFGAEICRFMFLYTRTSK